MAAPHKGGNEKGTYPLFSGEVAPVAGHIAKYPWNFSPPDRQLLTSILRQVTFKKKKATATHRKRGAILSILASKINEKSYQRMFSIHLYCLLQLYIFAFYKPQVKIFFNPFLFYKIVLFRIKLFVFLNILIFRRMSPWNFSPQAKQLLTSMLKQVT